MTHFLALGWVCSLVLLATGGVIIPASEVGVEVVSTGTTGADRPSDPRRHPVHTAEAGGDDLSRPPRASITREPATTGSSSSHPPLWLTDDVSADVSAPNDNHQVANGHRFKRSNQTSADVDSRVSWKGFQNEVTWADSWPALLASQVLIYTYTADGTPEYVVGGYNVGWDGEGPVFTCGYRPMVSERLFLSRNFRQNGRVYSFAGGAVKIRGAKTNRYYLKDRKGDVLFHFQPVEGGDGDLYSIFHSKDGVPNGPPARCAGNLKTVFHVRVVAYPDRVSKIRVVESRSMVYNTTRQYAATDCNSSRAYDYTSNYANTYLVQMLGGAPNVTLEAPVPRIKGNIVLTEGTFFARAQSEIATSVTIPHRRAMLVVVTWEEKRSTVVWTGVMSHYRYCSLRTVAGRVTYKRIRRLISVETYPGDLFAPGECRPILKTLSSKGVAADGERVTWFDNKVDYKWVPRLKWMDTEEEMPSEILM